MANIGDTITDGSAVWTIYDGSEGLDGFNSGKLRSTYDISTKINRIVNVNDTDRLAIVSGPDRYTNASLVLSGKNHSDSTVAGNFYLSAANDTTTRTFYGKTDGTLVWNSNDLAGTAIVAKTINMTGYVKYSSGLIIQWGAISVSSNSDYELIYPIAFTSNPRVIVTTHLDATLSTSTVCGTRNTGASLKSSIKIYTTTSTSTHAHWLAIGY